MYCSILCCGDDLLINILLQQPLGSHQIEFIILFEQIYRRSRIESAKMDRGGVNLGGHTAAGIRLHALYQLECARLTHQREVFIIDRDRNLGLSRKGQQRGQDYKRHQPEGVFHTTLLAFINNISEAVAPGTAADQFTFASQLSTADGLVPSHGLPLIRSNVSRSNWQKRERQKSGIAGD